MTQGLFSVQPSHEASMRPGGQRDDMDRYYTKPADALHLTRWVASLPEVGTPRTMIEPSVGGGAWVEAAQAVWPGIKIDAYDIDSRATGLFLPGLRKTRCMDWLKVPRPARRVDMVLGNPEYNESEAHTRHAIEHGRVVAFLLRLSFVGSQVRAGLKPKKGPGLWRDHKPAVIGVCSKRLSFRPDGKTDSHENAVFVFAGKPSTTRFEWIDIEADR